MYNKFFAILFIAALAACSKNRSKLDLSGNEQLTIESVRQTGSKQYFLANITNYSFPLKTDSLEYGIYYTKRFNLYNQDQVVYEKIKLGKKPVEFSITDTIECYFPPLDDDTVFFSSFTEYYAQFYCEAEGLMDLGPRVKVEPGAFFVKYKSGLFIPNVTLFGAGIRGFNDYGQMSGYYSYPSIFHHENSFGAQKEFDLLTEEYKSTVNPLYSQLAGIYSYTKNKRLFRIGSKQIMLRDSIINGNTKKGILGLIDFVNNRLSLSGIPFPSAHFLETIPQDVNWAQVSTLECLFWFDMGATAFVALRGYENTSSHTSKKTKLLIFDYVTEQFTGIENIDPSLEYTFDNQITGFGNINFTSSSTQGFLAIDTKIWQFDPSANEKWQVIQNIENVSTLNFFIHNNKPVFLYKRFPNSELYFISYFVEEKNDFISYPLINSDYSNPGYRLSFPYNQSSHQINKHFAIDGSGNGALYYFTP
jgi:hypothetical protein